MITNLRSTFHVKILMAARDRDIDTEELSGNGSSRGYYKDVYFDIEYFKQLNKSWIPYASGRLLRAIPVDDGLKISIQSLQTITFGYKGLDITPSVGNKVEVLEKLGRVSIIDHDFRKLYIGRIVH